MVRRAPLLGVLLVAACSAPVVDVTVAEPKVWGDDTVLRALALQRERLVPLTAGLRPGDYQEATGTRQDERTRTVLGVNLADPDAAGPQPPALDPGGGPWRSRWFGAFLPPLRPGLSFAEQLRQRVEGAQLLSGYELLFLGDARLLAPDSRAVLLRFDLSFNRYVDLGSRRRFVVVEFRVRGKREGTPRFEVYLLSPGYESVVSHERAVHDAVEEYATQLLGSWGGIGVSGSRGASERTRDEFEALLETPLQFAVYDARPLEQGGTRFAFAFGPRRRVETRSALSPARWFGAPWELAYELQPGPRTCQALLVFHGVRDPAPLELTVEVRCDGRLVAEEEVDAGLALRRTVTPLRTFDVTCPAPASAPATRRVRLVPTVCGDLLVDAGPAGAAFTPESSLLLGNVAVPESDVRYLGRGRLAVHVRPAPALQALLAQGETVVTGRVLTPDQPDFTFQVELVAPGGRK